MKMGLLISISLLASLALNATDCVPTTLEKKLLLRAVISATTFHPSLRIRGTLQDGYDFRWANLGGSVFVAGLEPELPDYPGVQFTALEFVNRSASSARLRTLPGVFSQGDLFKEFLTEEAKNIHSGDTLICTGHINKSELLNNSLLGGDRYGEIVKVVKSRLPGYLRPSYPEGGFCRGELVVPGVLENKAVGRLTCKYRGRWDEYFIHVNLSEEMKVSTINMLFDPPSLNQGEAEFRILKDRPRPTFELRF